MDSVKLLNGMLLIIALTTDSFVVSFAYGLERTRMPFEIVAGMNLIMSSFLGTAVLAGNFISSFLPENMTSKLGTLLLFGIGFYKVWEYFSKRNIKKEEEMLKKLTPAEGFILAFVLSLDSLAVGLGTGLVQSGQLFLAAGSFAGGIFMMELGWNVGYRFCRTVKKDLSWVSGACLLLLAFGSIWKQ